VSRVKYLAILLVIGAVLAVPAFVAAAGPSQASPLTITLATLNNSGESGTAVLTDLGNGQIKVDVTITGEPADGSHPMHIHTGQCGPTLGPVQYPLTNVVNGTSTTTVTATLASLMDGNHAINVHLSKAQIGTYVACGNIPVSAPATAPTTGGSPFAPVSIALILGILALGSGLLVRRFAR
jgi:CHRD domain